MNAEEKRLSKQIEYCYFSSRILRICIGIVQIFMMAICGFWVLANLFEWEITELFIGTGINRIEIKPNYWNVICFVLSMFSFFTVPNGLKEKLTTLKLARIYLKKEKRTTAQNDIIEQAKKYIDEVAQAFSKYCEGKTDEIEPHEKRMVLRKILIILGIVGISILTILLIFKYGWNVPQVAAVDLLIGYILVILEAYLYQVELRKAQILLLGEKHEKIIADNDDKREQFKLLQKINYMKADRLSNYSLVLSVAAGATNVISVVITILDTASDTNFQRMFALEIDSVNAIVATVFMIASCCFFLADLYFEVKIHPIIIETSTNAKIPYSEGDFDALKKQYEEEMKNSRYFSRKILDWARGIYEYNNDVMVRKYYREEEVQIPFACMATVESLFPGRVPRYKLTALILWLCGFMGFVWSEADIMFIFPITIMSFVVYDLLLLMNAVQLWNSNQKWLRLENEIEEKFSCRLRRYVKEDFIRYIWYHSVVMTLVATMNAILKTMGNIHISWYYIMPLIIMFNIIGYCFVEKEKKIKDGNILRPYFRRGVLICGSAVIVGHYIISGRVGEVFFSSALLFLIFILEEIIVSFYKRVKSNVEETKVQFPIGIIFIILNWGIAYIFMVWDLKMIVPISFKAFAWLYVEGIIIIILRMLWGMIQMGEEMKI